MHIGVQLTIRLQRATPTMRILIIFTQTIINCVSCKPVHLPSRVQSKVMAALAAITLCNHAYADSEKEKALSDRITYLEARLNRVEKLLEKQTKKVQPVKIKHKHEIIAVE